VVLAAPAAVEDGGGEAGVAVGVGIGSWASAILVGSVSETVRRIASDRIGAVPV